MCAIQTDHILHTKHPHLFALNEPVDLCTDQQHLVLHHARARIHHLSMPRCLLALRVSLLLRLLQPPTRVV